MNSRDLYYNEGQMPIQETIDILKEFFSSSKINIIINSSTGKALICLDPEIDIIEDQILLKFNSLNERGTSVMISSIYAKETDTIHINTQDENILSIQTLDLQNYDHYIKGKYFNTPDFKDTNELHKYILESNS